MINCRFVFKFNSGGTSDSLDHVRQVHAVPRIGESISMINSDGSDPISSTVKNVIHQINTSTGEHEIIVHYG